jgi:TolB-like protein/Flp pilus assembly protein TadD
MFSLARMRERKLFQWGVAYAAGAWATLQGIDFLAEHFGWAPLLPRAATVVLAVGFVGALILAWYHGEKGRQRVSGPELLMLSALLVVAGAAVVMVSGPGAGVASSDVAGRPIASGALDPKRVAVLPFRNTNRGDQESESLALGIHDDLLSRLSRIAQIRVISRTSVMEYAETSKTIPEIAAELGAGVILEGGIQRAAGQVRVNVQLIDASKDEHLWSETFDRPWSLEALFAIQTDIVEQVASALEARLSAEERSALANRPTNDEDAYRLFVRARDLALLSGLGTEPQGETIGFLEQALARDSSFVEAWALLARMHLAFHWQGTDRTDERLERARIAAEKAVALGPQSPDAHLAMGFFHYQGELAYADAIREFEETLRLSPGDALAEGGVALVWRRQGRFEDALTRLRTAASSDPRNMGLLHDVAFSLDIAGRLDEARGVYQSIVTLDPGPNVVGDFGWNRLLAGDPDAAVTELHRLSDPLAHTSGAADVLVTAERIRGRQGELLTKVQELGRALLTNAQFGLTPTDFVLGELFLDLNEPDSARTHFEAAARRLEGMRASEPDDPRILAALGLTYATLARRDDAIAAARAAAAMVPVEREALRGAFLLDDTARTYARLAEPDAALQALQRVLSLRNALVITPALARLDPDWRFLREDPRFEALLQRAERGEI